VIVKMSNALTKLFVDGKEDSNNRFSENKRAILSSACVQLCNDQQNTFINR